MSIVSIWTLSFNCSQNYIQGEFNLVVYCLSQDSFDVWRRVYTMITTFHCYGDGTGEWLIRRWGQQNPLNFETGYEPGNNPKTDRCDQSQLRSYLIKCFTNQELVSFPKQDSDALPRLLRRWYQMNIFCYCRMPEDYNQVIMLCNSCENWFHFFVCWCDRGQIPDTWMCNMCMWFTNWPVIKK